MNDLIIPAKDFEGLPAKRQNRILYENVVHNNTEIQEMKCMLSNHIESINGKYSYNQRIQYTWLTLLTAVVVAIEGLRKYIPL